MKENIALAKSNYMSAFKIVLVIATMYWLWMQDRSTQAGLIDFNKVALPFFYLTLPNLLLVKQLGLSTLTLLSRQLTTIGIVVSVLNLVSLLGNFSDPRPSSKRLKIHLCTARIWNTAVVHNPSLFT